MGVDDKETEATSSALEQGFVVSPAEKRFLLLFTFLKKNRKKKVNAPVAKKNCAIVDGASVAELRQP